MNFGDVIDFRRWIKDAGTPERDYSQDGYEPAEPSVGDVWSKAAPDIERALSVYNKLEDPNMPNLSWNPFAESRATCQKELDQILDVLLGVLGVCGAANYRQRIKELQDRIISSRERIGEFQEKLLSAPAESSQSFVDGLTVASRESLGDSIADEKERIRQSLQQIEDLKKGFRKGLQQVGIQVTAETADSFLLPVHDEIVAMAAVITNISRLTEQLQQLVEATRETPSHTKRYYGVYVLLVLAVDRIQNHFVSEIDQAYIPRLQQSAKFATRIIADAQVEIRRGGPQEQLLGNVSANKRTIDACQKMTEILVSHKRAILEENMKVKILLGAAVNSYRTVRLSLDVAELIGACESAFRALRDLRIPPLRTFKNVHLNEELQKLADQITQKGGTA